MMFGEFISRIKYWSREDRISPEYPLNHWRLYFHSSMTRLCKRKFKYFGEGAEFRAGAYAADCSNISIGKRVVIRPNSILFATAPNKYGGKGSITIEDNVLFGPAVQIYAVEKHKFQDIHAPIIDQGFDEPGDVLIKAGSWIGAGSIIIAGVTIGSNSVIGAGSIVTRDIPDHVVAVGVPAKVIKELA